MTDVLGGPWGDDGKIGNFKYEYSYGLMGGGQTKTNEVYGTLGANIGWQRNGAGDDQVTAVLTPYAVQLQFNWEEGEWSLAGGYGVALPKNYVPKIPGVPIELEVGGFVGVGLSNEGLFAGANGDAAFQAKMLNRPIGPNIGVGADGRLTLLYPESEPDTPADIKIYRGSYYTGPDMYRPTGLNGYEPSLLDRPSEYNLPPHNPSVSAGVDYRPIGSTGYNPTPLDSPSEYNGGPSISGNPPTPSANGAIGGLTPTEAEVRSLAGAGINALRDKYYGPGWGTPSSSSNDTRPPGTNGYNPSLLDSPSEYNRGHSGSGNSGGGYVSPAGTNGYKPSPLDSPSEYSRWPSGGGSSGGGSSGGGGSGGSGNINNGTQTSNFGPRPIVLDLDGNGLEITELSQSNVFMDAAGTGLKHRTAWAAAGDGVLFFDPDNRNAITEKRQYVFTEWDPTAKGDLEAVRNVWDTNGDGKLTALDTEFGKFKLLVTQANGSQIVQTLTQAGITEINLKADQTHVQYADGSAVTGQTTFTRANATTGTVANMLLATEATGHAVTTFTSTDVNGNRVVINRTQNGIKLLAENDNCVQLVLAA